MKIKNRKREATTQNSGCTVLREQIMFELAPWLALINANNLNILDIFNLCVKMIIIIIMVKYKTIKYLQSSLF